MIAGPSPSPVGQYIQFDDDRQKQKQKQKRAGPLSGVFDTSTFKVALRSRGSKIRLSLLSFHVLFILVITIFTFLTTRNYGLLVVHLISLGAMLVYVPGVIYKMFTVPLSPDPDVRPNRRVNLKGEEEGGLDRIGQPGKGKDHEGWVWNWDSGIMELIYLGTQIIIWLVSAICSHTIGGPTSCSQQIMNNYSATTEGNSQADAKSLKDNYESVLQVQKMCNNLTGTIVLSSIHIVGLVLYGGWIWRVINKYKSRAGETGVWKVSLSELTRIQSQLKVPCDPTSTTEYNQGDSRINTGTIPNVIPHGRIVQPPARTHYTSVGMPPPPYQPSTIATEWSRSSYLGSSSSSNPSAIHMSPEGSSGPINIDAGTSYSYHSSSDTSDHLPGATPIQMRTSVARFIDEKKDSKDAIKRALDMV
ncbi:hypothetical protein I302_101202 [Kwoniella bestiolae CBS 10118]|uniref:Uncharacterized protein n=1 Tax=Kwoniella bestiolae CBS 10118 TaxID=1296100 RepID=A0A1B9G785_9TREE|nr:hypothetical protein I302_04575 [Kwoniella bestiolae CBS 10118]OCF26885.1 hypothetical protein I302_04575 [Kwoniella bestiolae CBS 10118]